MAKPGTEVVVYVDNTLLGRTKAKDGGAWEMAPDRHVEPGLYRLRVDQIEGEKVTARVELPFRSEEHTSELQSLMRISYAVFCLKKKKHVKTQHTQHTNEKHH